MSENNEVAVRDQNTAVALPLAPIDMSADAGAGLEYVDPAGLSLPFYKVLQSGSPETKRANEKFIPGAAEGMILNTLTGELFDGDKGIRGIICSIQKRELEWAPKAEGLGRPVASYPFGSPEIPAFTIETIMIDGKPKKVRQTASGTTLNETDEIYFLRLDEHGNGSPGVIAMDSSDLGCSRKITSQLFNRIHPKGFKVPIYGQIYTLFSADKHKDDYDWKIWKAVQEDALVTDNALYNQAKGFHGVVEPKQLVVNRSTPSALAAGSSTGSKDGDNIPF